MDAAATGAIRNMAAWVEPVNRNGATLAATDVDYAFRPIGGQP